MSYSVTGSGAIKLLGCASFSYTQIYDTKFGVRTSPYVLESARHGRLEKITIKVINVAGFNGENALLNYVDTFNEVWLEDELGWQQEAVGLAEAYYERVIEGLSNEKNCVKEG